MRRYGLVVRLSFLAIALGDFAGAFSLINGYSAFPGRFISPRSAVGGGSCSKPGVIGLSAAVATTAMNAAIQDKISKWERKAQRHFSVPSSSTVLDLQQVAWTLCVVVSHQGCFHYQFVLFIQRHSIIMR